MAALQKYINRRHDATFILPPIAIHRLHITCICTKLEQSFQATTRGLYHPFTPPSAMKVEWMVPIDGEGGRPNLFVSLLALFPS